MILLPERPDPAQQSDGFILSLRGRSAAVWRAVGLPCVERMLYLVLESLDTLLGATDFRRSPPDPAAEDQEHDGTGNNNPPLHNPCILRWRTAQVNRGL